MNDRQRRIQALLRVLADRSRFDMLCALADGPTHVSDLAVRVGLSQSCATRHVQALLASGAVECRRAGKRVLVDARRHDEVVATLLAWIAAEHDGPGAAAPAPADRAPAEPRARRERAPRIAQEILPPASPPDSGTPPPAKREPEPASSARTRPLEDFLL